MTRIYDLVSHLCEFITCKNDFVSRIYNLITHIHDLVSCIYDLVTHIYDIVYCIYNLKCCMYHLITHIFDFVLGSTYKRVNLGVSQHISTCFGHRIVWNSRQKLLEISNKNLRFLSQNTARQLTDPRVILLTSDITERVLASSLFFKEMQMPILLLLPSLVLNPNSVSVKPSRPVSTASSSGLKSKARDKHAFDKFSGTSQVPIKNRFKVLEDSHEYLFETQENAPSGLDGMVTALAVPTTIKIVAKKYNAGSES